MWLAIGPAAAQVPGDKRCREESARQAFLPALPDAKRKLAATGRIAIVALGSSATQGAGASAPERSYPAVLEAELRRRMPQFSVTVANEGVGGQSAYEMVLRMDEIAAARPALVIWQTGVNEAVRDAGAEKFGKILRKGIGKMRAAGIDLVMMDLPWLAREERYPSYEAYRAVLGRTAAAAEVPVFPRYATMRSWARARSFSAEELVGMDGYHMLDAAYRCLAIRLAEGLVAGLTGVKPNLAVAPAVPR